MKFTIIWIKGKNCVGKTTFIRKMLNYEEEPYYKYTPNTPQRYSLENNSFNIIKLDFMNLIVRVYLKIKCKKCNDLIKLNNSIKEQKIRLQEKESNFRIAERILDSLKEPSLEIETIQQEINDTVKKMELIKEKAKINFKII